MDDEQTDVDEEQIGIMYVAVDGLRWGPYCMACAEEMEDEDALPTGISTLPRMVSEGKFDCPKCGNRIA